jgi:hypothetical protein
MPLRPKQSSDTLPPFMDKLDARSIHGKTANYEALWKISFDRLGDDEVTAV